jgi:hypothetical protein
VKGPRLTLADAETKLSILLAKHGEEFEEWERNGGLESDNVLDILAMESVVRLLKR